MKLSSYLFILIITHVATAEAGLLQACYDLFAGKKSVYEQTQIDREQRAWDTIRPSVQSEINQFRLLDKEAKQEYLDKVSTDAIAALHETFQTSNLGFHYNLHGGSRESYVASGGIHATVGDIAVHEGFGRNHHHSVYFFQSQSVALRKVLEANNPAFLFKARMGNVLIIFNMNAPILKRMEQNGVITKKNEISMTINVQSENAIKNGGVVIGIPKESFVMDPLMVFDRVSEQTGIKRLTWDEQTLITMRFIEEISRRTD